MILSIFYDHLAEGAQQRCIPLDEALLLAKRAGIDRVELNCDVACADPAALRAQLERAGLRAGSLFRFFDFGHAPQPERVRELLDTAERMGTRHVLAVPGFLSPEDDAQACLARMDEALTRLCEDAASRGIDVLMEDFDSTTAPYATARQLRRFLDAVPALGCALDTGNFLYAGDDVLAAFALLRDRIRYVHLKDRARTPRPGETGTRDASGCMLYSASVGSGVIPMAECLRLLREMDYDGVLAIEHYGSPDQLGDMERSAAFVRAHF